MSKKSKDKSETIYKLGDVVLAKIKGYPPWPGMIVNPEEVPPDVARERPGGKKSNFCVRFFPAGDHAWTVAKDLSLLQKHEIEAYINEPHKKSGDLLKGYRIAMDPTDWAKTIESELQQRQDDEANAEIDQLDGEEEMDDDDEDKKKSKKRKRESDAPKSKSKKKASMKGESNGRAGGKKKSGKKNGTRANDVESEDEGGEDAGPSKSHPSKRAKKEKEDDDTKYSHLQDDPDALKVKDHRHKLQRTFLGKAPATDAMLKEADDIFRNFEGNENLSLEYLSFSKIGKVMRHIANIDEGGIPQDEQYKFRERAEELVRKWHKVLNTNGTAATVDAGFGTDTKPEPLTAVGDVTVAEEPTTTQPDVDMEDGSKA